MQNNGKLAIIPESEEMTQFKILIANDEMMQLQMLTLKFKMTNKCSVD